MTGTYRLFGVEMSPYSVKVRSYLRYKQIAHQWVVRGAAVQSEFQSLAKLPLIPMLVTPDGEVIQDSTPLIAEMERRHPEPALEPPDVPRAFLSALIEEYADEWGNKAMFHYRWTYPQDRESAARRITDALFEGAEKPEGIEDSVRTRMVGRLYHVGSSAETAPVIEGSFTRVLAIVDRMVSSRPYLFGGRPSLADFGLAAQFAQLLSDPTPGAIMRAQAPNVVRWVERMENPKAEGALDSLDAVKADLEELLRVEVAGAYLAWMAANARAVTDDASGVSVEIAGVTFTQKPQRYAAKAFAELQRKRASVEDVALTALLTETGCDAYLVSGDIGDRDDSEDDEGDED